MRCRNCKWWLEGTDETDVYRWCMHPECAGEKVSGGYTQAYDDCGEIHVDTRKDFGCILFEEKQ